VGEYIDDDLKKLLFEKHNISLVLTKAPKRKSELDGGGSDDHGQNNKKLKTNGSSNGIVEPTEDYGSSNASPALNSATVYLIYFSRESVTYE
jgi:hypothetical protein